MGLDDIGNNNTLTVHIKQIREKIKDGSKNPIFIETMWGRGYRFIGEEIEEMQRLRVQPRDFVTNMLKASRKTNIITNEGQEKILGIKTLHNSIVPKEKELFEERHDLWVSKENWVVIKSVMKIPDTTIESKYTDIDFSVLNSIILFGVKIYKRWAVYGLIVINLLGSGIFIWSGYSIYAVVIPFIGVLYVIYIFRRMWNEFG